MITNIKYYTYMHYLIINEYFIKNNNYLLLLFLIIHNINRSTQKLFIFILLNYKSEADISIII